MQKSDNLKLLNENDKFRFDSTELSNNFNKLLQQYELLNKNYKNIENLFNVTKIDKDNLLKDMTIYKEKTGIEDSMKQKEINRLNSLFNTFRSEKTEMESKLSSENGRLKEELDKMYSSRNESEIIMKREFNNLKLKYDEMLEAKNYTEIDFMEKEKYIKSLEQEIQKKSSIKNCPGLDNIYHEVKLAIHSCLSVASVFMKKYKKTYSKDLDESYANFDIGNDYQAVIESLHNLEDWLAVVCKEMEGYIFMPNENAKGSYNYKDSFNQLSDDYNNLFKSHEKTSKELKSFKNDNKKLYDQTKKFYEENIKTSLVIQENKFYVSLLKNILRSHPYKEISKYYSDVINFNDGIINFENEKIKLVRRIDNLERELSKCKKNPNVELEKTLSNEISNLKISMSDLEKKINEKKEKIYLVENEIKMFDEKINSYTNMNVFKANYLDKNSSIVTNLEYDSRKLYRNSELKKQSEMNDNNSFSYSSQMQENNSHINNFRRQNENQNKII
jgi:CII-binding regulator of phage lambda lysogenization HflD